MPTETYVIFLVSGIFWVTPAFADRLGFEAHPASVTANNTIIESLTKSLVSI